MILTTWGYSLTDSETLTDFLTPTEFNQFTGNKFSGDVRIEPNIKAATSAIRNYCGWHVSPNLTCSMLYRVQDLRDAFLGCDLLVQLPATYVTTVRKVVLDAVYNPDTGEYDGEVFTDFSLEGNDGLLRLYDVGVRSRKSNIYIKYDAGIPDTDIQVIKELTANRVTHAIANPYGVMSEAAGGVSVSYSSTWANSSHSTSLPDDNREVLEPYRVKGVF